MYLKSSQLWRPDEWFLNSTGQVESTEDSIFSFADDPG
jgi:hypothetical protein